MTFDGKSYFVTFIDQFSHFSVVYPLSHKSEDELSFKNDFPIAEAKFNRKIPTLRCDNGGEYSSQSFKKFCLERGIRTLQPSAKWLWQNDTIVPSWKRHVALFMMLN